MILNRRKFLIGVTSLVAAPAIVRATSLMQISSLGPFAEWEYSIASAMMKYRQTLYPLYGVYMTPVEIVRSLDVP